MAHNIIYILYIHISPLAETLRQCGTNSIYKSHSCLPQPPPPPSRPLNTARKTFHLSQIIRRRRAQLDKRTWHSSSTSYSQIIIIINISARVQILGCQCQSCKTNNIANIHIRGQIQHDKGPPL